MVSARDALIAFVIRAAGAVQAIVALGRDNGAAAAVAITTGAVICPDFAGCWRSSSIFAIEIASS
jgi:hypothetical protein